MKWPILSLFALCCASCARVSVDPIEVKPIHIVMDVNIRVDRELDEFFAFEDGGAKSPTTVATTQPATGPAAAARRASGDQP